MTSRRAFLKLLGFTPFAFFTRRRENSVAHQSLHQPEQVKYHLIDEAIKSFLQENYNVNVYPGTAKYLREMIQIYSGTYQNAGHVFRLNSDSVAAGKKAYAAIGWRELQQVINTAANKLDVSLWYAPNTDYGWLDNYLKEHLEAKHGLESDLETVRRIREWAQTLHYIYQERIAQFMSFSLHKDSATRKTFICSRDVIEWIQNGS